MSGGTRRNTEPVRTTDARTSTSEGSTHVSPTLVRPPQLQRSLRRELAAVRPAGTRAEEVLREKHVVAS